METAESKFGNTIYAGSGGGGNTSGGGTGGAGNTGGGTQGENQPAILDIQGGVLQASTENAANKFTFNHAGGEITFVRANEFVDSNLYPNEDYTKPTTWKSGFVVLNETQIEVTRPYQIFEKSSNNFIVPENLVNVPFSMSFEALVHTPATSSNYLTSYADVTIGNLRTLSGDVHRAKIFVKEQNKANAELTKIGDFQLQPKNELRDEASATGELSLGLFYSQSVIDTHWISSSNTSTVISQNNQKILNAALLKGSSHPFTFKTRKNFTLQKNEDYITSFDGYYNKVGGNAEIELFITGSSLSSTNQEFSLGRLSSNPTSDFYSPKMANDSGSLQGIYNFFKTHQLKDNTPSTAIGFRVHSGEFHIANVGILPVSDRNFNPGFVKTRVPMPPTTQRGQRFDFVTEFYDFNNNKSQVEALTSQSIQFNGPPQVLADGTDATFSGSMVIGESMEMFGVNPAYLRSVGYEGFTKTITNNKGGFMLFSGSVKDHINSTETYQGVGLEIVDAHTSQDRYFKFGTNPSKLEVVTDTFLFGVSSSAPHSAPEAFISGSNGNLRISSSGFFLDTDGSINAGAGNFTVSNAGAVTLAGTITAAAGGTIGGFTIATDEIYKLDSGTPDSSPNNGLVIDSSGGANSKAVIRVYDGTTENAALGNFASGKFGIKAIEGDIGGFTIDADEIKSTNLLLDSNNEKITVGSSNAVTIQGGGTDNFITMGKTTFGQTTTVGAILGMDATVPTLELFKDANNKFIFNDSGIDIKSTTFDLNAGSGKLIIDSSTPSIALTNVDAKLIIGNLDSVTDTSDSDSGIYAQGDGKILIKHDSDNYIQFNSGLDIRAEEFKLATSNLIINNASEAAAAGKIIISGADQHIKIGTGISIDGDGDSNTGKITVGSGKVVLNGNSDSTIAGWTIGSSTISSNNLILNSSGLVETSTYVSGLKGFRLSAEGNGFLEVENARIRGTLKTTVFEKETVNAVGGQLQVGNATTITGSSTILAAATKIPVDNVSGFTGSEVIMAKRISNTGFQTEYMLITSHSFATQSAEINPKDETNMSGSLFVVRGYSGSAKAGQVSSSLGGIASAPIDLEPGQVLVSTGFHNATTGVGSGYIRLNANPNDTATPFIDIVERTGSAIYDVDLKARLGDLSGLSSAQVGSSPGFGLFTDRAFLTKDVTIGTLGSEHILIGDSSLVFKNGSDVKAQLDGNTWTLGGATGTTTDAIKIAAGGVFIYDNSDDYVKVTSAGLNVYESGNNVATFGANSTITGGTITIQGTAGSTGDEKVVIENNSISMFTEGNEVFDVTGAVMTIGSSTDKVTINGTSGITIRENNADSISLVNGVITVGSSTDKVTINGTSGITIRENNSDTISMVNGVVTIGSSTDQIEINGTSGITIRENNKDNITLTDGTIKVGVDENDSTFVQIDSDSVDIIEDVSGTNTTVASFGILTTIGDTGHEHLRISGSGLELKDNNTQYIGVNQNGMSIGNNIVLATNGNATFNGTVQIGGTNLDATNTLNVNTTAANVGLGNVDNTDDQGTTQGGLIDGVTITGGGITIGSGGVIKSSGKDDVDDTTSGFFLGSGGSNTHDFAVGDATAFLKYDGSDGDFDIKTKKLELDASSGNIGLHMSSSIGMIKAFSGSHDTAVTIVGKSGVNSAGALQVTQSGMPIFQAGGGENQVFASVQNMTMNSIPQEDEDGLGGGQSGGSGAGGGSTTEIGDAEELIGRPLAQVDDVTTLEGVADLVDAVSASAGIGIPTVRMATAVVGAQLSASRFNAGESMFLKNTKIGASKNTKFRVFISDNEASGAAAPPVNAGFDIRKVYKDGLFSNSHEIRQSMAFSSFITSGDADARFVKNGQSTGSAIFHFQNILSESADNKWADGKYCLMRLDADNSNLNTSGRRTEFVHLEARSSTGTTATKTRVFQLQHDGEIVAAGDITGFGTSFMNVSDERLKQDIYNVTGSLNKILDLRPTHFTWKENKQEDVGFIAQEVEEVIPEVVQTKKGFINTDGEEEGIEDMKTISYPKLIPYLVDTIQELTKRIEELEKSK